MAASGVEVEGLAEFVAAVKAADAELAKAVAKGHREIAQFVSAEARKFAYGEGPMQGHFAAWITGRGDQRAARLGLKGKQANAAFWGAKKRTGWYGRYRYKDSTGVQLPAWVGNSWEVGGEDGPYALNPAIRFEKDEISRRVEQLVMDVYGRAAFPD